MIEFVNREDEGEGWFSVIGTRLCPRNFWKRARLNYSYGTGCTTHGGRVTPRRCSDRSRTRFDQFGACCPPTFTFVRVQRVLWPIYARITGPCNACARDTRSQSQNRSRSPDLVAWYERGSVAWTVRSEISGLSHFGHPSGSRVEGINHTFRDVESQRSQRDVWDPAASLKQSRHGILWLWRQPVPLFKRTFENVASLDFRIV